ncbi:Uncharacterized conserved protein YbbC, DUF1343 family [Flavobacteriaceae bacterium MAR_2010_188]|nr:Uncharacterized conserved protein YbbC, DUF1343 family [Flavobacteriaceae bacterium MAR_2010_188]
MGLRSLKNTALLLVIFLVSCANAQKDKFEAADESTAMKTEPIIITAADQTELYLPKLTGKRVGVVANQTSVIFKVQNFQSINPNKGEYKERTIENRFTHLIDSLISLNIKVEKVFSPEHGFRGTADAGELVKDGIDAKTGLSIISLHGKNKKPTLEQMQNIDIMVFDIQDVGVRFYTYLSTLHYVMEACAEANIPLLVLDRPNPNGQYVDGPVMEKRNFNFLGLHPVPLVYGMSIGEYAKMINGEKWLANEIQCDLTVINLKNYTHDSEYNLAIRPSPNLPNDQAIKLYPSLGLFEGTDVNAGRGTDFQFQRYGAPFLDSTYFDFNYTPVENFGAKFPKHKDETCFGEDLSKTQIGREMTLKWIIEAYQYSSDKAKVFNSKNFTAHAGTDKLQKQIEEGLSEKEIKNSWSADIEAFKKIREKYLIYN